MQLQIKYENQLCHFATTETLAITTPTHRQQDGVSCSKMTMGVTPKLYSLEGSLLFEVHILGMERTFFTKIAVYIFFNMLGMKT